MSEQFDRTFALLKFDRDELIEWLADYFSFNERDGTDCYHLMRSKTAFGIPGIEVDDFVEFDQSLLIDLADFILQKLRTIHE